MAEETVIMINGTRLTDTELATIRAAIDTFTYVLAEGIETKDAGVTGAATEDYLVALTHIRRLLENPTTRIQ